MSKKFNEQDFFKHMVEFLQAPEKMLDQGFSLKLQNEALSHGHQMNCLSYLMSDSVQSQINAIATETQGTTMDLERKHYCDRRGERHTVVSSATLSSA